MNMPKSRDIQTKMPSPKVILNAFWLVTVKVLNSYIVEKKRKKQEIVLQSRHESGYCSLVISREVFCVSEGHRKPETYRTNLCD